MATLRQIDYLDSLLIDCGFGTRVARNEYLSSEVGREINTQEASKIIDKLKELKEENRGARWTSDY